MTTTSPAPSSAGSQVLLLVNHIGRRDVWVHAVFAAFWLVMAALTLRRFLAQRHLPPAPPPPSAGDLRRQRRDARPGPR